MSAHGRGGAPSWAPGYRHRTAGLAPVPFRYRTRPEDFLVEELPLEPPAGEGTHMVFELSKRGISTVDAVRRIARTLERQESDVGFAGRKDAFAVTRQWISIEHVDPAAVEALTWPELSLRFVDRHTKKLRLGQLTGNRFRLRLVNVPPQDRERFEQVLATLARSGLPNYYGHQRFGRGGTTWRLGYLLVKRRTADYLAELVASEQVPHADAGGANGRSEAIDELAGALASGARGAQRRLVRLVPRLPADLAALARQLARRPGDLASAQRAVPKRSRRFHLSAFQSRVFNRVLAARLAAGLPLESCVPGDVALRHADGRALPLDAAVAVRPDVLAGCEAFELSATGPMPGTTAVRATGQPGELEAAALAAEDVELEDFAELPEGFAKSGARRAVRVPVSGLRSTWRPDGVELAFDLPPGSYATTLLEELRKDHAEP